MEARNTQFMDHIEHRWTSGSLIPLFRPDPVVVKTGSVLRDHTMNPNHVMLDEDQNDPCISFDFIDSELNTFHMHWNMSLTVVDP